jgi:WD40 repeat protein
VWQVSNSTLLTTLDDLNSEEEMVHFVAFSPDGTILASVSANNIRLYQVSDWTLLRTLENPVPVNVIAFSPDGSTLVSGGKDSIVRLWQVSDGQLLYILEGHTSEIRYVTFSPDGTLIGSGSNDQTVRLWQVKDGVLIHTLEHPGGVRGGLKFSPDGTKLTSISLNSILIVWDVVSGNQVQTIAEHTSEINSVACSSNGTRLATGTSSYHGNRLGVWQVDNGTLLYTLQKNASVVAISPDSEILASVRDSVTLRRLADGAQLHLMESDAGGWDIVFSPDGTIIASGASDTVKLWQVSDGKLLRTLEQNSEVRRVAFSPDGKYLASGGSDQKILLWNTEDWTVLRTLEGHTGTVHDLAFSPDGTMLVSGAYPDYKARVWRVSDGALLQLLDNFFQGLAFSPDGQILVVGEGSDFLLWQVENWKLLHTLEGHTGETRDICFFPNGKTLASVSGDGTVRLWGVK